MDIDDTFLNGNGLPVVVNVLVFRHLYRLVFIGHVVEFFKGYKVFSTQSRSVERVFHFNLHVLIISGKGVAVLDTLPIDKKLCVVLFQHLPAHKLILRAFLQAVQLYRVNDCYLFSRYNGLFAVLAGRCGMDRDFLLVLVCERP